MLPRNHPDRIRIVFDDHRLVANAGLLLPATLARHLGLRELVDHHLDLGGAPGRANTGDKLMTLVASAMAGGDCIDAADVVAHRWDGLHPGRHGQGAIHPGHLPAQLPVGPRPPAGPGEPGAAGPGLGRWGRTRRRAVHHRPRFHHLRDLRTGQGGRPPPRLYRQAGLPPAAGHRRRHRRRADVPAARGPGQHRPRRRHFLRETVGRVRYAGANGRLTLRADSGFYTHGVVSVCRKMDVRFSITIRQHKSLRNLIEAIPEDAWTPIPYWMDGGADVAETTCTPFQSEPDAAPVRLIVRRVKPTPVPSWPSSPPTAITASSPTGTGRCSNWRPTIAATPRSRMPSETSSTVWG